MGYLNAQPGTQRLYYAPYLATLLHKVRFSPIIPNQNALKLITVWLCFITAAISRNVLSDECLCVFKMTKQQPWNKEEEEEEVFVDVREEEDSDAEDDDEYVDARAEIEGHGISSYSSGCETLTSRTVEVKGRLSKEKKRDISSSLSTLFPLVRSFFTFLLIFFMEFFSSHFSFLLFSSSCMLHIKAKSN